MRDQAWFESRGNQLYRSFLWKVARTITSMEKAGYDPRTLHIPSIIEHAREEMKSVNSVYIMDILTKQKNGFVQFQYLHGMGYVASFHQGEFTWETIDDSYEDALQRLFDSVQNQSEQEVFE